MQALEANGGWERRAKSQWGNPRKSRWISNRVCDPHMFPSLFYWNLTHPSNNSLYLSTTLEPYPLPHSFVINFPSPPLDHKTHKSRDRTSYVLVPPTLCCEESQCHWIALDSVAVHAARMEIACVEQVWDLCSRLQCAFLSAIPCIPHRIHRATQNCDDYPIFQKERLSDKDFLMPCPLNRHWVMPQN